MLLEDRRGDHYSDRDLDAVLSQLGLVGAYLLLEPGLLAGMIDRLAAALKTLAGALPRVPAATTRP